MTRAALARKSGLRYETVVRAECGRRLRRQTVERLAGALPVEPEQFMRAG